MLYIHVCDSFLSIYNNIHQKKSSKMIIKITNYEILLMLFSHNICN